MAERLLLRSLREKLANGEYPRVWTDQIDSTLHEQLRGSSTYKQLPKQPTGIQAKRRRLVGPLASDFKGSDAVGAAVREADQNRLKACLEALADQAPVNLRAKVTDAAYEFTQMIDDLPSHMNEPESLYAAREALREWLGEVRIGPTDKGPVAYWRINDEGLLISAGPRVAKMVAGARLGTCKRVSLAA